MGTWQWLKPENLVNGIFHIAKFTPTVMTKLSIGMSNATQSKKTQSNTKCKCIFYHSTFSIILKYICVVKMPLKHIFWTFFRLNNISFENMFEPNIFYIFFHNLTLLLIIIILNLNSINYTHELRSILVSCISKTIY